MKIIVEKPQENFVGLARRISYIPVGYRGDEFEMARPIAGRGYPRFHIYARENKEKDIIFLNLHLDQKKPSYGDFSAHSGEYEGPVVEQEVARIKQILNIS